MQVGSYFTFSQFAIRTIDFVTRILKLRLTASQTAAIQHGLGRRRVDRSAPGIQNQCSGYLSA